MTTMTNRTISMVIEGKDIKARTIIKALTSFVRLTEEVIKNVAKEDGIKIKLKTLLDINKTEKGFEFILYWKE